MSSQTSPKAQAVVAVLILALSVSLYLWPNEQSENTISEDLSQVSLKKLPLMEWRISKNPEPSEKTEPYNQPQEGIQNFKQAIVEPLNNLLNIKDNIAQQNQEGLLSSLSEPEEQPSLLVLTDIFSSSYSVTPDCYREGPAGPTGINVKTTCCNCGKVHRKHHGCSRTVTDQDNGGRGCLDPSICCENYGCLNKECPGKPAIWDPATGECGC